MIEKKVILQESDNVTLRFHDNLDSVELEQNNESIWIDPKDLPELTSAMNGLHLLIIARKANNV